MSKRLFTENDILLLSLIPNVKHVSEKSIIYTDQFKPDFMVRYLAGNSPTRIFENAGFDKDMIGYKQIECAASRMKIIQGLK